MNLTEFFKRVFKYLFYFFIFILPWQTKLVLLSGQTNYTEISLYVSQSILFVVLISFFIYKLRRRDFSENISALWYFLIGLELFIFGSFFVALDQTLAFYHYLVFLEALGLFYLLREGTLFKGYEETHINKFTAVYVFLGSIFLQASLGIYQFLTQYAFAFKYLGLATHNPQDLGVAVVETASGRFLRAYGGFDHPNIFGGVLVVALILAVYLLAKKKVLNSNWDVFESIFLFIFYFTGLLALFFTFSRGAWLALALGLLTLLVSFLIRKDRWMIGRFLALSFFSAFFLFIIISPYQDLLMVRIDASSRLEQKSITERLMYFKQAEELIKNNLVFGVGIGNYTNTLNAHEKSKQPALINQPVHNVLLLLTAENGILALFFFCGFLVCLILKNRRENFSWAIFIAMIVLMMLDHWLISLPFGVLFLFFILGLI